MVELALHFRRREGHGVREEDDREREQRGGQAVRAQHEEAQRAPAPLTAVIERQRDGLAAPDPFPKGKDHREREQAEPLRMEKNHAVTSGFRRFDGVGQKDRGDLLAAHLRRGPMQPVLQLPQRVPGLFIATDRVERRAHRRAFEREFFAPAAEQEHLHFRLRLGVERAAFELGEKAAQHLSERRLGLRRRGGVRRLLPLVEDEQEQPHDPKHGQPGERGVVVSAHVHAHFLGLLNPRVELLRKLRIAVKLK